MKSIIPVFPLNLVMYPGAVYPLHIFEERYKRMISRCRTKDEGFGIISKIDSSISTVGCYVNIVQVMNVFENGSMDISVQGKERFKTVSTELHSDGYLIASVIPYDDEEQYIAPTKLESNTIATFKEILNRTEIEFDKRYWLNFEKSRYKSYKIAEKSGMNLKQKQNLLLLKSEYDRLDYLFKHFKALEEYLDRTEVLKEIISGDGYIN